MRAIGGTRNYSWFVNALSTLALLVPWVGANDANNAFAPDDFAFPADLLH
jgi:hypothetical protein